MVVQSERLVEGQESFTVTISNNSTGTIVTNQALGQINNDDQAVLSIASVAQAEGNAAGSLSFTASLSNPVQGAVRANVSSADGSAVEPSDYAALNQAINFASGATTQTFAVATVGETIVEANEAFTLSLSNLNVPAAVAASVSLSAAPITGTLSNDDSTILSVSSPSQAEGNASSTPMPFIARLSNPVQGQVRVTVNSANDTAIAGSDYTALTPTLLMFPSLSMQQPIQVAINGDTQLENDETFNLNLSGLETPVGISAITLSPAAIIGTILNDDAVTVSVNDVRGQEGTANPVQFNFTATLSSASAIPVSVNFNTLDGTATSPADYNASAGTLIFAPGETTKTTAISIVNDSITEPDESFQFALSAPSAGATLPARAAIGTIQNDDFVTVPALGWLSIVLLIGLTLVFGARARLTN